MIINENLLADVQISSEVLNITEANYVRDTKLYVSIHDANGVIINDQVFTLNLDVRKAGYLSEMIGFSESDFANEVYAGSNSQIISSNLSLEIQNRVSENAHDFELLQNVPNPFNTTTEIGFVLPGHENVSLRVMDVTGKVLIIKTGKYKKGYNSITLNESELNGSGILYYQLDTERNSASKKMIIIK